MNKIRLLILLALASVVYCDWLKPGWLEFGLPTSWNKPLTIASTYDLQAGVEDTTTCMLLAQVPDKMKPGNWLTKPEDRVDCRERLKQKRAENLQDD